MEEKNIGEKLWKKKNCRTKFLDRTKQKNRNVVGDREWEREREKHTKDGIGGEIEKVNGMLGPPCGDGVICAHAWVKPMVGRGLCVINREF